MLIRTVRMTFRKDEVANFLKVFNESKTKIRNFPGCTHLDMLKDYHTDNIYLTYSFWENADALENYRNSKLFEGVWAKTKVLFKDKPLAFSSEKVERVEL